MPDTSYFADLGRCQIVSRRAIELTAEKRHRLDSELRSQSDDLRRRRLQGDVSDDLLAEALAICGETYARTLGESLGEASLIAAVAMCTGLIAEVPEPSARRAATTLAAYWYSLRGKGVHVVVESDGLLRQGAVPMTAVGASLGLRVGLLGNGSTERERRVAYASDVTLGGYLEFMWDYLRDGLRDDPAEVVSRDPWAAIIGEADAILVNSANVPATITVPAEGGDRALAVGAAAALRPSVDYGIRGHDVRLTRAGLIALVEKSGAQSLESLDISLAQRVESLLSQREGLARQDERRVYSWVSARAYFRCYPVLVGVTNRAGAIADEVEQVYGVRCLAVVTEGSATGREQPDVLNANDNATLDNLAASAGRAASSDRLEGWRYEQVLEHQRLGVRSLRLDIRKPGGTRALVTRMIGELVDEIFRDEDVASGPALQEVERITGRGAEGLASGSTCSRTWVKDEICRAYSRREEEVGASVMRRLEREVLLTNLDLRWYGQLNWLLFAVAHARELYPGNDVLSDYRRDASRRYDEMMTMFKSDSLRFLFRIAPASTD